MTDPRWGWPKEFCLEMAERFIHQQGLDTAYEAFLAAAQKEMEEEDEPEEE